MILMKSIFILLYVTLTNCFPTPLVDVTNENNDMTTTEQPLPNWHDSFHRLNNVTHQHVSQLPLPRVLNFTDITVTILIREISGKLEALVVSHENITVIDDLNKNISDFIPSGDVNRLNVSLFKQDNSEEFRENIRIIHDNLQLRGVDNEVRWDSMFFRRNNIVKLGNLRVENKTFEVVALNSEARSDSEDMIAERFSFPEIYGDIKNKMIPYIVDKSKEFAHALGFGKKS